MKKVFIFSLFAIIAFSADAQQRTINGQPAVDSELKDDFLQLKGKTFTGTRSEFLAQFPKAQLVLVQPTDITQMKLIGIKKKRGNKKPYIHGQELVALWKQQPDGSWLHMSAAYEEIPKALTARN